ncbi:MAG: hypothetical protein IKR86_05690 [Candidatus Methanomethylophilaceae archaeon]|nr:hypothetical protein [Candidatus Methanomethylophilaceae archaeon]
MDWDYTRSKTNTAYDILSALTGIVLGVTMVVQGAYRIYRGADGGSDILFYAGYVTMVLGGSAVAVLSLKDRIRMIGAYALTLGFSRLFLRLEDMFSTTEPVIIIIELMFVTLAVNFIRVGYHFARGNVVSRTSLIVSASILASTDLLLMVADQYASEILSYLPFSLDPYFYLVNFLMYVAIVALLDTKIVRENTVLARYARVLDRVRSAHSLDEVSYISEDAARGLLERTGPLWRSIDDRIVQSEMVFDIVSGETRSTAVAQIWKGREPLFMTVVHEGDSVLNANRFRIDEVFESEGMLFGRGKDGTSFRVLIKREEAR